MSFRKEVISFIISQGYEATKEPWGIRVKDQPVGFQLHTIERYPENPEECPEAIHMVHLWEDLWRHKREIMDSRIASLLGNTSRIHARETQISKLTKPQLIDFLTVNHLGMAISGKHKWGLLHNGELVAVAAFGASCPVHRKGVVYNSYELVRFCNKNGATVVGGLSKLVAHFIKEFRPDDIMSYADLDWSLGKSYTRLGFKKIGVLPPQTFYVDPVSLQRYYKLNAPEEKLHLLAFENQGSAKYLLDLKKKADA